MLTSEAALVSRAAVEGAGQSQRLTAQPQWGSRNIRPCTGLLSPSCPKAERRGLGEAYVGWGWGCWAAEEGFRQMFFRWAAMDFA